MIEVDGEALADFFEGFADHMTRVALAGVLILIGVTIGRKAEVAAQRRRLLGLVRDMQQNEPDSEEDVQDA